MSGSNPQHLAIDQPPNPDQWRQALLAWYDQGHRLLPWRPPPGQGPGRVDPYAVLVSEAMLQQTQVATVIPYFERFMAEFPTVADLAAADEQAVLAMWQGLGYYRRARSLHAAARAIVDRNAGRVPDNADDLLNLPGVGRYTAGAVASIAYDTPAPIVDGNVARVFARLVPITDPIDKPDAQRRLWSLAADYAHGPRPGDANQALMELGATVCTPRTPHCLTCPLRHHCQGVRTTNPESLPVKSPRRQPTAVTHDVLAVRDTDDRYLFTRRPDTGLWAGMWQLPTHETARVTPTWLRQTLGLPITAPRPLAALPTFDHRTTHRLITFRIRTARLKQETPTIAPDAPPIEWRKLDQLADLPLANPQKKIVAALR
ncbi:MAG: A/G-specific adenine glycosylase [Planctomycetota bacterium]